MKTKLDESKYLKIKLADILTARMDDGCLMVMTNRYWEVTPDDCVLFYRGVSPQCNIYKNITEQFRNEDCRVEFIPVAYIKCEWTEEGMVPIE